MSISLEYVDQIINGDDAVETQTPEVPWIGWHFLARDCKLRYNDGRKVIPGKVYRAEGVPRLCKNGMHASALALDALKYAPGPIICRVELFGDLIEGDDKAVARCRKVLWMADATRTLHLFSVWCAERALIREREAGREPDARSWNALKVKREWLDGKATDDELTAARAAARDAAWEAYQTATYGAAWEASQAAATCWAAWVVAYALERDPDWAAERAAAQAVARDSAEATEKKALARKLESMLLALKS